MQMSKFSFLRIKQHKQRDSQTRSNIKAQASNQAAAQNRAEFKQQSKLQRSHVASLRESKTNKSKREDVHLHPIAHRYSKSSLQHPENSIQEPKSLKKANKKESGRSASHIQSIRKDLKSIKSERKSIRPKMNTKCKIDPASLIESFMCKSIEPTPTNRSHSIKQLKSLWPNRRIHEQSQRKMKNSSMREQMERHRKQENSSAPTLSQAFLTKMKKKRVESNPHLLATIIKRKQEVLSKHELYDFVRKIIKKCAKDC